MGSSFTAPRESPTSSTLLFRRFEVHRHGPIEEPSSPPPSPNHILGCTLGFILSSRPSSWALCNRPTGLASLFPLIFRRYDDGERDPSPPSWETSTTRVQHILPLFYFRISFLKFWALLCLAGPITFSLYIFFYFPS